MFGGYEPHPSYEYKGIGVDSTDGSRTTKCKDKKNGSPKTEWTFYEITPLLLGSKSLSCLEIWEFFIEIDLLSRISIAIQLGSRQTTRDSPTQPTHPTSESFEIRTSGANEIS